METNSLQSWSGLICCLSLQETPVHAEAVWRGFSEFFLDLSVLCCSSLWSSCWLCPDSRPKQKKPELLVVIDPAAVITGSVSAAHISSVSLLVFLFLNFMSSPLCLSLCCSVMFPYKQELDDDVSSVRSYRVCTGFLGPTCSLNNPGETSWRRSVLTRTSNGFLFHTEVYIISDAGLGV